MSEPRTPHDIEKDRLAEIIERRSSLRDRFAMAALNGYLSSLDLSPDNIHYPTRKELTQWSYEDADAMMKAREMDPLDG